jgi:DNA polymerase-1
MKNKIALIDGDSLIYYEMNKPSLDLALEGIDSRLEDLFNKTEATHFAGFLTTGKCFRYDRAKTRKYKGNRKHSNKPIIFPAIKEYLRQEWKFKAVSELEADDLVSVYHTDPFGTTVICSPDKDVLYQNRGIHYNYGKAETVVVDEVEAITFLWKQVLMGDSTDGIPGLPKIGPKTANTWLKDIGREEMPTFVLNKYIETFGNHEGILKFVETFRLIYILKTHDEVKLETGVELPELEITEVNIKQNTDELWE